MANVYSNRHDLIASPEIDTFKGLVQYAIDATVVVKGMILRNQALLLPFRALLFKD